MALLESEEETAMFLESKEGFEVQMQGQWESSPTPVVTKQHE